MLSYELIQVLRGGILAIHRHNYVAFAVAHFLTKNIHFFGTYYYNPAFFIRLNIDAAKRILILG